MPIYIRKLPCSVMTIVDQASVPQNHVLFNPSFAEPIIYLRGTEHFSSKEINYALLFDMIKKESRRIESPMQMLAPTVNLFQGIEDLRICWANDHNGKRKLWFTGTTTHATNKMVNELVVGYFNDSLSYVEYLTPVDIGSLPVKNVCPFVWNDKLHLLDTFKLDIFCIHMEKTSEVLSLEACKVKKLRPAMGISEETYRGSTSPVHLHGNTWGCVVHDIIFNDNTKLVTRLSYIHHWMEFDIETGMITFISTPFWVAHWGIEYVSGIHYEKEKGDISLYVGVADRQPILAKTTLHDIRIGK